jgi:hypothetical protein
MRTTAIIFMKNQNLFTIYVGENNVVIVKIIHRSIVNINESQKIFDSIVETVCLSVPLKKI